MVYLCEYESSVIQCVEEVFYNTFNSLKSMTLSAQDVPPEVLMHDDSSGFTSYKNKKYCRYFLIT